MFVLTKGTLWADLTNFVVIQQLSFHSSFLHFWQNMVLDLDVWDLLTVLHGSYSAPRPQRRWFVYVKVCRVSISLGFCKLHMSQFTCAHNRINNATARSMLRQPHPQQLSLVMAGIFAHAFRHASLMKRYPTIQVSGRCLEQRFEDTIPNVQWVYNWIWSRFQVCATDHGKKVLRVLLTRMSSFVEIVM